MKMPRIFEVEKERNAGRVSLSSFCYLRRPGDLTHFGLEESGEDLSSHLGSQPEVT